MAYGSGGRRILPQLMSEYKKAWYIIMAIWLVGGSRARLALHACMQYTALRTIIPATSNRKIFSIANEISN